MNRPNKLVEFEILRAVSIILLLFAHSDVYSQTVFGLKLESIGPYSRSFFLGAFFFMAGYFAQNTYNRAEKNYLGYLRKKIVRLIPPYWLSLLAFIIVLGNTLKRPFDLGVYILDLQVIFSPAYVKPLLTLWYLSVVLAYYVIFGLFLSRPTKQLAVFSFVVFFACLALNFKYNLFDTRFFEFYFVFLTGVLFSRYNQTAETIIHSPLWVQFVLLGFSSVLYWYYCLKDYQIATFSYLTVSYLFGMLSVVIALRMFRLEIFHWKIWLPISYASFFAYLFHRPVWAIMFMIIKFPSTLYSGWYMLFPGIIFVLVISYYMQYAYDLLLKAGSNLWTRLTLKAA